MADVSSSPDQQSQSQSQMRNTTTSEVAPPNSQMSKPKIMDMIKFGPKKKKSSGDKIHVDIWPAAFDLIMCIVLLIVLSVIPGKVFRPPVRGYSCADSMNRYPKEISMASDGTCWAFSFLIVLISILLVEFVVRLILHGGIKEVQAICSRNVVIILLRFAKYSGSWLIGFVLNLMLSTVTKLSVGRVRPHFFMECVPTGPQSDRCHRDHYYFVEEYTCTTEDWQTRVSFYSSRASFVTHSAVFVAMYLQQRLPQPTLCYMLRPLLQVLVVALALFLSFLLVGNSENFISDVLVGIVVGFATATYSAVHIARMFRKGEADNDELVAVVPAPAEAAVTQETTKLSETKTSGSAEATSQVGNAPPTVIPATTADDTAMPQVITPYSMAQTVGQSVISDNDSVLKTTHHSELDKGDE